MGLKKIKLFLMVAVIVLSPLLFNACAGSSNFNNGVKEVYYFRSLVHKVNKNIVTLSDGSVWRLNRFLITVNLAPVYVVLPRTLEQGYMFINGMSYRILGTDSPDFIMPSFYHTGYYELIGSIDTAHGIVKLFDGSEWAVNPKDSTELKQWDVNSEVVISQAKNEMINLRQDSKIRVRLLPPQIKKND